MYVTWTDLLFKYSPRDTLMICLLLKNSESVVGARVNCGHVKEGGVCTCMHEEAFGG